LEVMAKDISLSKAKKDILQKEHGLVTEIEYAAGAHVLFHLTGQ